jgi:hypothetical protein
MATSKCDDFEAWRDNAGYARDVAEDLPRSARFALQIHNGDDQAQHGGAATSPKGIVGNLKIFCTKFASGRAAILTPSPNGGWSMVPGL